MDEKRHFGRVLFGTEVLLEFEGERYRQELTDVSLNGALVTLKEAVDIGSDALCRLTIPLSEDVQMTFQARAVHFEQNQVGLKFTEADTVSLSHLRRLLELNTGNPERIENELHFLAGDL